MFDTISPTTWLGEIEDCQLEEAIVISRRMTAIAGLLWHRTGEAEDAASDDPGYALITGFTRTCAEVSAAMNLSVMAVNKMVGQAEALGTRLPEVARLLAEGKTDWRTVALIIARTSLVDQELMPELDRSMAERIINWQCWSRHISVTTEPNGMARVHGAMPAPAAAIDGSSDQPGYLEGYGVIDADQVRQLAESATLRMLSEPTVSDAAALRYQPSAALERWIRCRDLTCRLHHHRLTTFHDGLDGWRDEQLPDGTAVLTSPTGRVYRSTPAGAELFPQMRGPCAAPLPRRRSRRREKSARTALARRKLDALRAPNAETRRVNRARCLEIDLRMWGNNMRKTLLVLKGGRPSTSPWCTWVNEPLEDVNITADWVPPPPPPPTPDRDEPPF